MNKTIIALAATFGLVSVASAADLPARKTAPVYVPPALTWNGFYVGANAGASWKNGATRGGAYVIDTPYSYSIGSVEVNGVNQTGVLPNYTQGALGITGGLQAGYNWQVSPMFMVGAETDFQGTSMGSGHNGNVSTALAYLNATAPYSQTFVGASAANQVNWFGTVRGRVGVVAMPSLLVYGTGGFAYGDVQRVGGLWTSSAVQTGWTAGGGVEYKFTPNWSVKGEYLYTNLSGNNTNSWYNAGVGVDNINNKTTFQTVRAGLNYNFVTESLPTLAKF